MENEIIGAGSTTLDYLRVRYQWLGQMIDESERSHARLSAELMNVTADRERLRAACASALSLLRKLGGHNHDPEYTELLTALQQNEVN